MKDPYITRRKTTIKEPNILLASLLTPPQAYLSLTTKKEPYKRALHTTILLMKSHLDEPYIMLKRSSVKRALYYTKEAY